LFDIDTAALTSGVEDFNEWKTSWRNIALSKLLLAKITGRKIGNQNYM
jgi:hypothetical protein